MRTFCQVLFFLRSSTSCWILICSSRSISRHDFSFFFPKPKSAWVAELARDGLQYA